MGIKGPGVVEMGRGEGEGLRLSLSRTSGGHNWTCRNTY